MTVATADRPGLLEGDIHQRRSRARLLSLAVATPELCMSQDEIARRLADLWHLRGKELQQWQRMIRGSMIARRHAALPPEDVVAMTTSQRMSMFDRLAPGLASDAALRALRRSGVAPWSITDLIVVTCTGFSAPGVDVELVERLGLARGVHRTIIGFMGCFGGLIGLRTAAASCAARPHGAALLVCIELCSLHIRLETDPQNLVASALFADGAAAAVVVGEDRAADPSARTLMPIKARSLAMIESGRSALLPEGRSWMSWRITDAGFAMTLARQIPEALRLSIGSIINRGSGAERHDPTRCLIVHPGGAAILDAVQSGLDVKSHQLDSARAVLHEFGNMSSGTVLFVLAEQVRRGLSLPATMLAFGPGLSIETIELVDR